MHLLFLTRAHNANTFSFLRCPFCNSIEVYKLEEIEEKKKK